MTDLVQTYHDATEILNTRDAAAEQEMSDIDWCLIYVAPSVMQASRAASDYTRRQTESFHEERSGKGKEIFAPPMHSFNLELRDDALVLNWGHKAEIPYAHTDKDFYSSSRTPSINATELRAAFENQKTIELVDERWEEKCVHDSGGRTEKKLTPNYYNLILDFSREGMAAITIKIVNTPHKPALYPLQTYVDSDLETYASALGAYDKAHPKARPPSLRKQAWAFLRHLVP